MFAKVGVIYRLALLNQWASIVLTAAVMIH